MRSLSIFSIAFACIGLPQFASAADLPAKAPVPPAVIEPAWTGFYFGLNFGYGWGNQSVSFSPNNNPFVAVIGTPAPVSFDTSGAVAGFQIGYDWRFSPNWLVGIEADFDFSSIKGDGTSVTPTGIGPFTSTANEHVNWFGTIRGRLGFLPTPNLLLYGTGGFAYGRVKQNVGFINNTPIAIVGPPGVCFDGTTCFAGSSSRTATGWTAGGGLEYALSAHGTIRVEYLYVNLGSSNTFAEQIVLFTQLPPVAYSAAFGDTTFNIVRAGLNYRF